MNFLENKHEVVHPEDLFIHLISDARSKFQ